MRHHFLVCYDIADPTRLRKVHRVMRDFGDGIQLSVFACELSPKDKAQLEERLLRVLNQDVDQIIFFRLGPCKHGDDGPPHYAVLGKKMETSVDRSVIV